MKIMNIFYVMLASALALAMPMDAASKRSKAAAKVTQVQPTATEVDAVIGEVRSDLETAINDAAKAITEATMAKNRVRKDLADGKMTQDDATAAIAKQDALIAQIKQDLIQTAEAAVAMADEVEQQASYASQFISGAQILAGRMIAPFRAGYGYTEQEKSLARAIIAELQELKKTETDPVVIQQLDNEIYQQKLITGEEMSIQKKLLLGAALTAATVAGVYLASQYFGAAGMEMPVVTGEVQPPSIPGTTTPTVTIEPSTITPTITPTMPLVTPEVPATPEVEITPTVPTTITEAMPLVTPEVPVVVEPRELELRELSPYESFLGVGKPRELSPFEKIQEAQKEVDDARERIKRDKYRIKRAQEWLVADEAITKEDMLARPNRYRGDEIDIYRKLNEERIAEEQRGLREDEARLQENLQKVEQYKKEIVEGPTLPPEVPAVVEPRELSPFEKIQEAQKEIDDAREWINRDKDRIKETQEWLARHEEAGIKDMALLDREFLEERIAEAQRRLRKEEARLQENLQKVEKYEKEIADAAVVEVTEIE